MLIRLVQWARAWYRAGKDPHPVHAIWAPSAQVNTGFGDPAWQDTLFLIRFVVAIARYCAAGFGDGGGHWGRGSNPGEARALRHQSFAQQSYAS